MPDSKTDELSNLMKIVAQDLIDEAYFKFCEVFDERDFVDEPENAPLEPWIGINEVLANVSGYKVVLQAAIVEPTSDDEDILQFKGYAEVASSEPVTFVRPLQPGPRLWARKKSGED